ncbi:bifunctional protein-serine/threonine kinase/phosphatase [Zavarzinia compransoris]|uniref:bifunctional protein-serine/threonine kinase/phosphatase n=1 Tax=Zavarzinia marina TaxID=2911065 RepID=UPI001F4687DE|nr:bifunctional protein-serine/threonine kinase/phosphatase [Zavarzinia marina]MCF4164988.1 bifunctional protein-serine/threonine kinase/phosphatase [Zavarzinia marina]
MMSRLSVAIGQWSDAGRKPAHQDFHGALVPEGAALTTKGIAAAIADGISSSPVGAEAAEIAVKSLLSDYYCTPDAWSAKTAATRVIIAINAWLHAQNRRARLDDRDRGHVCTLSALILKGRKAHLFHVGDSRIWRLAGQALEPLTEDHRLDLGPGENYLARALGAGPEVEIDYRAVEVSPGDRFLLTTDGVHEWMDARAAARLLAGDGDPDEIARLIGAGALEAGSPDNLTVQVLRVDGLPAAGAVELADVRADLPVPGEIRPGAVIDGFRVLRQIHGDARARLFLAATADGGRVALKIPARDILDSDELRRRFLMEEWIARRIASPHVMAAASAPERRSALYAVTEFIDGQSLRQWMRDHPAPSLEAVRGIVEQIAIGLRAFHRREMLHRDLRPENVMVDGDGTVKIIDFGAVRVAGLEDDTPPLSGEAMLGTLQYSAPEYLAGEAADWRADLFSLGVVAYEMLTGRLPYGADAARGRGRARHRLVYRPARDEGRPVPDWVDHALARAVHPDPARRHEALSEFTAALRAPGPDYRARNRKPLIERDPLRFWQGTAAALALLSAVLAARLVLGG